jgi:hypothetical protein
VLGRVLFLAGRMCVTTEVEKTVAPVAIYPWEDLISQISAVKILSWRFRSRRSRYPYSVGTVSSSPDMSVHRQLDISDRLAR